MYYQGLLSLIAPSQMMICGTLTLRYLFRIVLSGAVAKGEDFITSGSVTRQGGYVDTSTGASRSPVTFAISFTTTPGLAWTTDYASIRGTNAVSLTGFDTTINYDRKNAKIWYIAIGI